MPKKNYVFDTNVLIHDPTSVFRFQDNDIYIPIYVLEEIDGLKNDPGEKGHSARRATRILDDLRFRGSLTKGVKLHEDQDDSGTLFVYTPTERAELPVATTNKTDHAILQSALDIKKNKENRTIFVTMDINLRVRAEAMDLQVAPYEFQSVDISDLGNKVCTVDVSSVEFEMYYKTGVLELGEDEDFDLNTSILMTCDGNTKRTALGRVKLVGGNKSVCKLNTPNHLLGIKPRNMEQQFAIDLLLDDDIKLVTIFGSAGTGKTLLSIAAGLYQITENKLYDKLLISRPAVEMGRGIGFIPGTIEEKMQPYMQPFYDNLDYIMMSSGSKRENGTIDDMIDNGVIQIEPLTFIRGRSIANQFMIVDECFPYNTPITTEFGKRKIGSLFSQWIKGRELPLVKSFDKETQTFVWKKITNMFYQGVRDLILVTASNRKIKCTPNHPFLTDRGWVKAEDLTSNDLLVSDCPDEIQINKVLSGDCEQILLGSFLGDGSIEMIRSRIGRLSVTHGLSQSLYCKWKAGMFDAQLKTVKNAGYNPGEDKVSFCSKSYGLPGSFPRPKIACPQFVLDRLDERGLAIWFMDDGSAFKNYNGARIHTESFDDDSVDRMIIKLKHFGIKAKKAYYKGNVITFNKKSYLKLCKLIAPYIHSDLSYKIHEDYRELNNYPWKSESFEFGYVQVTSINNINELDHVFDMEVEDTHNFIVPSESRGKKGGNGGVVVHNCQNLTPHEVKTIITRCGANSKIVFTGDVHQIDNPYISATSNGLSVAAKKLNDNEITGSLELERGERSELANLAAEKM